MEWNHRWNNMPINKKNKNKKNFKKSVSYGLFCQGRALLNSLFTLPQRWMKSVKHMWLFMAHICITSQLKFDKTGWSQHLNTLWLIKGAWSQPEQIHHHRQQQFWNGSLVQTAHLVEVTQKLNWVVSPQSNLNSCWPKKGTGLWITSGTSFPKCT